MEFKFQEQVKEVAEKDPEYQFLWQQAYDAENQKQQSDYKINSENLLTFIENIYIPNQMSLKELILDEYH